MFCKNCGAQLDDADRFCMSCGCKVEENVAPAEQVAAESPAQAEPMQAEPVQTTVNPAPAAVSGKKAKVKKPGSFKLSKGMLALIISGAGVVCIALLVLLNLSGIKNFYYANMASPDSYYKYVEKQQADELASMASVYYGQYADNMDFSDKKAEVQVSVELGESFQDLLSLMGMASSGSLDIDWLESLSLKLGANVKNQKVSVDAQAIMNKKDLLSGKMILDCQEETMYFQVPDLNKSWLGAEFRDMNLDYDDEIWEQMATMAKNMPDSKDVDKLLEKYIDLALDHVKDVKKKKDTLKTGGISQNCTKLTVTIDEDTLQEMAEAILEVMGEDKDLEKLIRQVAAMDQDVDPDDVYDEFLDMIDEALDTVDDIGDSDIEIVMTLWVDGSGNIRGRQFEYNNVVISYIMPFKGSEFGFEAVVKNKGSYVDGYYYGSNESITIEGTGKKSGNKLNGTFEIGYGGAGLVDIQVEDFDTKKLQKGELSGHFVVQISNGMASLMGMSSLYGLTDYSLDIVVDTAGTSGSATLKLLDGEEMMIAMDVSSKLSKGSKVSVPASKNVIMADDEDALIEWVEDLNFDDLLDKLEDEVGVSSDIIDYLEAILDWYM